MVERLFSLSRAAYITNQYSLVITLPKLIHEVPLMNMSCSCADFLCGDRMELPFMLIGAVLYLVSEAVNLYARAHAGWED